jgi:hypothetical protein
MNQSEIKRLNGLLRKLIKSNLCRLACAAENFPTAGGVYVISRPSRKTAYLYVGMSGKITQRGIKGLRKRANLHLHNNSPSDLRKKCRRENEDGRELTTRLGKFQIRCLLVPNERLRTRLEYFAIAVLNPRLNKL